MKTRRFLVLVAVTLATLVTIVSLEVAHLGAAPQTQASAEELPDAPGKAVVERVCTVCHGTDYIAPSERTVPVWRDTFELMKGYGAEASDEEWKTINAYIMANLAYLDVNKATADDIGLVLTVDERVAKGIVAYRDKQGSFRSVDDLKKAPDTDAAKIDAAKERLIFESN